jgi:hypothetical protein
MAESHFVSGLKQRRSDRLGELEQTRKDIAEHEQRERSLLEVIEHIDALLTVEDPNIAIDRIKPRKPRGPHPRSGGGRSGPGGNRIPITQAVLRLLRTRRVAMTAQEVIATLQPDYADHDKRKLAQNVRMFLSTKKREGVITAAANGDGLLGYVIAA